MDGSFRLRAVTLTLFLVFLTLAAIDPKFCYGNSEVHCIQSEQQALLRFKQDLTDPLNRLASWAGDGDCCQWKGVVCNNVTGHVQELHLRSFPPPLIDYFSIVARYEAAIQSYAQSMFGGKINPSLLDLKYLFYLDLSYNNFGQFPIPEFLGSMKSLRYLNLFNAGFGDLIPPQIGNLSNLHYLNLGGFGYNSLSVNNLQWLSSLPLLQVLDLSGVDLSQASDLLQVTNKITSLSELWLSHCSLGSIPPTPNSNFSSLATLDLSFNSFENALIPSWVFGYQNLVALNLSANGFQGPIPIGLQNMTSLKHLDLSANNFNSSIPYWLYSFSHLEFLNLRKNLLQGKITSSIKNLTSAISIDLTSNQLDGKVPRSLGNVCSLRELRLSDNKLSQEVSEILESLLRCVSYGLEVLEMYDAQLSGHLIKELGQFQNLTTLSLEGNSIWGPIPISIGKLSSLRFLDLSTNQFNGTLPQSFGELSKLEYVFIGGNMLEGVVSETHFANLRRLKQLSTTPTRLTLKVSPNWIPPFQVGILGLGSWILGPNFPLWICSQKRVWSLDISNTNITDAIPPLFWNMSSQFNYLNLSHNHIYGEIPNIPMTLYPSSMIDMSSNSFKGSLPLISSNVSFLDLSNNLLSGSISHFLCYKKNEPKQMELLNLGKNLLSGNISYCWENWQKLLVLSLGNNNFNGSIPTSIEHLSLLKSLHLSNNKISGKLLHFLKNCTDLEIIDISENKFFGIIPSWIGQRHSSLIILNLRSNNFHGSIPKQLCALTSLQILDLSHNMLFGSIPRCVNNLNAMASTSHNILQDLFVVDGDSVDFERANLVIKGQVLEYTTNLGLLRTIDLSKNNLSGEIPKEVTSLQGLQSMNLSFNNLTGRIPENLGAMGSLESLDFSENKLSGRIPPSMSNLSFLSKLNLSMNNLSGRIPSSTQLQSLSASSFIGNKLCGPPLSDNCTINYAKPDTKDKGSSGGREVDWFYVGMALGFVVGFWVVWGPLLMNKKWRIMYFQFLDRMGYRFWVFWHKLDRML
ncbi:receptor-like protein EIX2 [Quercus lobata]|uniref:Leucine-rich repeat-containing N-terminal plant-type domain-containing protein n=1 Tax=Quercus lobata TaxID=97700 RepID=A0A7N2R8I7_QUELO|nr:receptor-like protein EIX2 [Quercus lobata]XP_030929688.1 receptor-like protein EIX2 [Quercus lobata]